MRYYALIGATMLAPAAAAAPHTQPGVRPRLWALAFRRHLPPTGRHGTHITLRGGAVEKMASLEDVLAALGQAAADGALAVVDFASDNCPPCDMIAPHYEELSLVDEFGSVRFLKVNVSDHPEVAEHFGVDGWPTFLFVRDGEVMDKIVGGNAAKAGLFAMVDKHA